MKTKLLLSLICVTSFALCNTYASSEASYVEPVIEIEEEASIQIAPQEETSVQPEASAQTEIALTAAESAAEAVIDLTEPENATFKIGNLTAVVKDSTLTISGKGKLKYSKETGYYYINKVVINEGVTAIENDALSDLYYMESITLPASLKEIERGFRKSPNLKEILVNGGNNFTSKDGVLYSADGKTLVSYPIAKTDKIYHIPSTTKEVGDYAFTNNKYLEQITTPSGLKRIGQSAFENNSSLTKINIPATVTEVGHETFYGCKNLKLLYYRANTKVTPIHLCSYCPELKEVHFTGKAIRKIGESSFNDCYKLSIVELPPHLEEISTNAFTNCTSLKDVQIPSTVKKIGAEAFDGTKVTLPNWLVKDGKGRYIEVYNVAYTGTLLNNEAAEILTRINAARKENGLSELKISKVLQDAAMIRAAENALVVGHVRPDTTDASVFYEYLAGEICGIAANPYQMVSTWMNSTNHASHILAKNNKTTGIGVFQQYGRKYYVQLFADSNLEEGRIPSTNEKKKFTVKVAKSTLNNDNYILYEITPVTKTQEGQYAIKVKYGKVDLRLSGGSFNWSSSNPAIATVSSSGVVKAVKNGTCTITATLKTDTSKTFTKSITIGKDIRKASVSGIINKSYTGKAIQQNVALKINNTILKKGTDYTVTYNNNINVGKAIVEIKGKGNCYGTIKKTFTIMPPIGTITKATGGKGKVTVQWQKKPKQISGYQIVLSTSSDFKRDKIVKTIENVNTVKQTVSNLKQGRYYVRLRTFLRKDGKVWLSKWSKTLSANINR